MCTPAVLRKVQHPFQFTPREQHLAKRNRGVVRIGEERVLDDNRRSSAHLQLGDEVFKEQERRLARPDGEVLLIRLVHARPERRICENNVDAVALREIGDLLRKRIAVDDVRGLEPVQDAVHLRRNVRECP